MICVLTADRAVRFEPESTAEQIQLKTTAEMKKELEEEPRFIRRTCLDLTVGSAEHALVLISDEKTVPRMINRVMQLQKLNLSHVEHLFCRYRVKITYTHTEQQTLDFFFLESYSIFILVHWTCQISAWNCGNGSGLTEWAAESQPPASPSQLQLLKDQFKPEPS